jgi:hypothetical protein
VPVWLLILIVAASFGFGGSVGYLLAVSRIDRIVATMTAPELEALDRRVKARRVLAGTEQPG